MDSENVDVSSKNYSKYYLGLSMIPGVGSKTIAKLVSYFKNPQNAYLAKDYEIEKLDLKDEIKKSITDFRKKIDLETEYNSIINQNIKLISQEDKAYPEILKEISDPPFLLFYKGQLNIEKQLSLAVVGTRKLTAYGKRVIQEIVPALVDRGFCIVSGLARGGDTEAHRACLKAGGKTIAVLGSGLNNIYPFENRSLAQEITLEGAIVSEFPPNMEPRKQNFPLRNRIITGLSLGVLVVEASEKSGTLITADCALDQNREVFAIPGSIFNPYSRGPAKLIKQGAKIATTVEDILEELNVDFHLQVQKSKEIIPCSDEEKQILTVLNLQDYVMIDELVRESRLETAQVLSTLTMMEFKGLIYNLGGGKYSASKS